LIVVISAFLCGLSAQGANLIKHAQSLFDQGNYGEVMKVLDADNEARSMMLKGRAYQACGFTFEAGKYFKCARALAPNDREIILWQYSFFATRKQWAVLAIGPLKEFLNAHPDDVALQSLLGRCLYASGERQVGFAAMLKAKAMDPQCGVCYENLANSYEDELDAAKAEKELGALIKQEPRSALPLLHRARVRRLSGSYDGAISDYSKTIQLFPDCQIAYFGRAKVLFDQGHSKSCLDDCSACLKIDSSLPELTAQVVCLKMKADQKLGLTKDAIEAGQALTVNLGKQERIERSMQEAVLILIASYRDLKEYRKALDTVTLLLHVTPKSTTELLLKANLELQMNLNVEALSTYDQMLAIDNDVPDWHRARGAILKKLGRTTDADVEFKKAAELDAAL
jgi:tetratricopeptide (TPR) repeat protein